MAQTYTQKLYTIVNIGSGIRMEVEDATYVDSIVTISDDIIAYGWKINPASVVTISDVLISIRSKQADILTDTLNISSSFVDTPIKINSLKVAVITPSDELTSVSITFPTKESVVTVSEELTLVSTQWEPEEFGKTTPPTTTWTRV